MGLGVLGWILSSALPASAEERDAGKAETAAEPRVDAAAPAAAGEALVYVPPSRGAPGRRVGGGTRAADASGCDARIEALVPDDHVGATRASQPVLQWYLFDDTSCRVDFVLSDPRRAEPVVERTLEGPLRAGMQSIRLDRLGAELEPGVEYDWSVAVVRDDARRSRDVVAGGTVVREAAAPAGDAGLGPAERAARAAREGLWYDALAALSEAVEARPGDAAVVSQRAALLEQVGLGDVAASERGAKPAPR
jgi:hypothetical protein